MVKSFWEVINKKDRSGVINYRNNNISIDLIINKNNFSNDTVMKSNNVGDSQTVFLLPKVKFANHGLKALPYYFRSKIWSIVASNINFSTVHEYKKKNNWSYANVTTMICTAVTELSNGFRKVVAVNSVKVT